MGINTNKSKCCPNRYSDPQFLARGVWDSRTEAPSISRISDRIFMEIAGFHPKWTAARTRHEHPETSSSECASVDCVASSFLRLPNTPREFALMINGSIIHMLASQWDHYRCEIQKENNAATFVPFVPRNSRCIVRCGINFTIIVGRPGLARPDRAMWNESVHVRTWSSSV